MSNITPISVGVTLEGEQLRVTLEGEQLIVYMDITRGTTQGDPLSMSMYAVAMVPLIRHLHSTIPAASQVWFADDATAVGSTSSLLEWQLVSIGPACIWIFSKFIQDIHDC